MSVATLVDVVGLTFKTRTFHKQDPGTKVKMCLILRQLIQLAQLETNIETKLPLHPQMTSPQSQPSPTPTRNPPLPIPALILPLPLPLPLPCSSPKVWRFVNDPMNKIDLIAIVPFYIELLLSSGGGMVRVAALLVPYSSSSAIHHLPLSTTSHLSPLTSRLSPRTSAPLTSRRSPRTSHLSPLTSPPSGMAVFRVVRLVRIFRIFKMGKYNQGMQMFVSVIINSLQALKLLLFFLILIIVLFGSMMFFCEMGTW